MLHCSHSRVHNFKILRTYHFVPPSALLPTTSQSYQQKQNRKNSPLHAFCQLRTFLQCNEIYAMHVRLNYSIEWEQRAHTQYVIQKAIKKLGSRKWPEKNSIVGSTIPHFDAMHYLIYYIFSLRTELVRSCLVVIEIFHDITVYFHFVREISKKKRSQ